MTFTSRDKQRNQGQHSAHRQKQHNRDSGDNGASEKVGVFAQRDVAVSNTRMIAAQSGQLGNRSLQGNNVQPVLNVKVSPPTNRSGTVSYSGRIQGQQKNKPPVEPIPPNTTFEKRHIVIDGSNVAMA